MTLRVGATPQHCRPQADGPQNLFNGARERSSSRPLPHLSGYADTLIQRDSPTRLTVFLLLSVSWHFLQGSAIKGRGWRYYLDLGVFVPNDQFHCHPQTLLITDCLGLITTYFWRQTWGVWGFGGLGRLAADFPTAAQANSFDLC